MSIFVFEVACVVVVLVALFAMARRRLVFDLLVEYGALAVAGFLGEESCVVFYEYYHYAGGFHVRLDRVPVLVPLIWPLVVLSARDVADSFWPSVRRFRPLLVGAIVAFDASLVEVIAVRAGLWSWVEGGHLGVPIVGILGWGYFAIGADIALSGRLRLFGDNKVGRALLAVVFAPFLTHVLIQASWWGFFRYAQRSALGVRSLVGLALVGVLVLGFVVLARRRGARVPLGVAAPRMVAACLFFVLLLVTAPFDLPLWMHTLTVAIPYLVASELPFFAQKKAQK